MTDLVEADDIEAGRASVKEGMGFAAGSFAANVLMGLLSAVLTARIYGVDVIGEYALATAPWLTLIHFSSLAEQVALTRRVAVLPVGDPRVAGVFAPVLGFSFLLTAVLAVPVTVLGAIALRGPIGAPELVAPAVLIVAGYVLFENTSWNMDAVLSAFRAGRELFWCRLAQVGSFLVLSIAFAAFDRSVWAMAWATVASFVLAFAVRLVLLRRFTPLVPTRADLVAGVRELPSMLRFAAPLVPGRVAFGVTPQLGTWVLGLTASVRTVGAYSRAAGLAIRMNDAGYRVSEIAFPTMVQRWATGDRDGFERFTLDTTRLAALPLLIVAGAGGGAAAGILTIFGPGFTRAAGALALLLVAHALTVVAMIQGNGLLAVGRPSLSTSLSIVRLAVTVPVMFIGAHLWGVTGVALGALAGNVAACAVAEILLHRVAHRPGTSTGVVRLAVVALLATVTAYVVAWLIDRALPGFGGGAVAALAGLAAAVPVCLLPGGITRAEREKVTAKVASLRRRRGASS